MTPLLLVPTLPSRSQTEFGNERNEKEKIIDVIYGLC
jgi:hypothetical protein